MLVQQVKHPYQSFPVRQCDGLVVTTDRKTGKVGRQRNYALFVMSSCFFVALSDMHFDKGRKRNRQGHLFCWGMTVGAIAVAVSVFELEDAECWAVLVGFGPIKTSVFREL